MILIFKYDYLWNEIHNNIKGRWTQFVQRYAIYLIVNTYNTYLYNWKHFRIQLTKMHEVELKYNHSTYIIVIK